MKIAVYHNLPTGGAKRALFEIIRNSSDQHEYHVFTPFASNESFLDLAPHVKELKSYLPQRPGAKALGNKLANLLYNRDVWQIKKLQKLIAKDVNNSGCEVVLVTNCSMTQSPTVLMDIHLPTVFYTQEAFRPAYERLLSQGFLGSSDLLRPFKKRRLALIKSIDAAAIQKADVVLCNSYFSAESIMRAYGILPQVCYLGVDSKFGDAKPQHKQNAVVVVGAVEPFKNQTLVVEAIARIQDNRPTVELVYDREHPPYRKSIMALAAQKGATVNLHPKISDQALAELYANSLVTVCPALLEPFGFTPLESMMSGTPVIALRLGGYRETVIDGINGYLVDNDAESLAHKIASLQESIPISMRPTELKHYVTDEWSWQATVRQLDSVFQHLAKRPQ